MLATEVEHLLCLANASDHGAGKTPSATDERCGSHWHFLLRNPEENHRAVQLEQIEILIPVDISRDGVENQVKISLQLHERLRIRARIVMIGAKPYAVRLLSK